MSILLHDLDDLNFEARHHVKDILDLLSQPIPALKTSNRDLFLSAVATDHLRQASISEPRVSTSSGIQDDRLLGVLDLVLTSTAAMAELGAIHDDLGPRHTAPLWLPLLGVLGRTCHKDATVRYVICIYVTKRG